jgi:site-specific recombinase XerD
MGKEGVTMQEISRVISSVVVPVGSEGSLGWITNPTLQTGKRAYREDVKQWVKFWLERGMNPQLIFTYAEFIDLDVSNGQPSRDTVRGYLTQVSQWFQWGRENGINPAVATNHQIKIYKQRLVDAGYADASIAHKLTILRRFYAGIVAKGIRSDNPVVGIKPPKNKDAQDDFHYLTELQYSKLLDAVPHNKTEKNLRDKAIIAMMGLQMLRTVEIERANVEDITRNDDGVSLLVRGKTGKRTIYLTPEVSALLIGYLSKRAEPISDSDGTPLFTACGNRAGGKRISRRGIRQVVDFYLKKADMKRPGISGHALRHTGATLAYKYTHDIRNVQDTLGHKDPKTTARYAHVVDRRKNNPVLAIPVPDAIQIDL